jgi:methyl-accepting chemotaxis protein
MILKNARSLSEKAFKDYESMISNDEDKRLLEAEKADAVTLFNFIEDVLVLSRQNKNDQARDLLQGKVKFIDELGDKLDAHIDFNVKLGNKGADDAQDTKDAAAITSLAIALSGALLLGGLGVLLVRELTAQLNEVVYVLRQMEKGDMTAQITKQFSGQLEELRLATNNTILKLSQTIKEVMSASEQLSNASEQVSATSQSLSQATSEQAASVEETSSSIEEMTASINQNAENAKVTDGMASKAAKEAIEGGSAVQQTVQAMKEITTRISIIDDIAYQTNMLALNAAIEAARAGDHGKGFAVVAAEVRKLAERSQVAAQQISELAEDSVKAAERAGELINAIVPGIGKTSDLVQEISAASIEQSSGANQINNAMNQMNQITQQNASASEQLAATAEEMSGQAEQLSELMRFFTIGKEQSELGRTNNKSQGIYQQTKVPSNPRLSKRVSATELAFDETKFERF